MNTELTTIENTLANLDQLANSSNALSVTEPSFVESFKMATAIKEMRQALTPEIMQPAMELMNTPLGFRTDRDPTKRGKDGQPIKSYPISVVKESCIEAMLRGIPLVGNCFNIIAGRMYVTKEGFSFLLAHKVKGMTDLKKQFSVPVNKSGGAIVEASATWLMNGQPQSLERSIPVKVNAMMGTDAVIGKAERKLLASVYSQITGSSVSDGEAGDESMMIGDSRKEKSNSPTSQLAPPKKEAKAEPKPEPKQEKATEVAEPEKEKESNQPEQSESQVPCKEELLERIASKLAEEDISKLQFESYLRSKSLISMTGTMRGKSESWLNDLAGDMARMVTNYRKAKA